MYAVTAAKSLCTIAVVVVAGCSSKPAATKKATTTMRFEHISPKMDVKDIARLGARAFQLCNDLRSPVNPLRSDRTCRWAYLYTAVACNRGRYVSCVLAGRLARTRYGDESKVATAHLETACEHGVETACKDLEENRFAKPPPGSNKKPGKKRPRARGTCDEVACLLASNPRPACCNRFKKKRAVKVPHVGPRTSRRRLSRVVIAQHMRRVRGAVMRCNRTFKAKGRVNLRIRIAASGRVTSAHVTSSPHAGLGRCVAGVIRRARFPVSRLGASVVYPFVFR